jgi:1,2-phenylacetyl-CoA epoxidase catalytic subunit
MTDRVSWDKAEYGRYLRAPYHKEFQDDLFELVPDEEREWDHQQKRWWISDGYLREVDQLLSRHFVGKQSV